MARTKGAHTWSDEEISIVRRLRRQGAQITDIGEAIGRKPHCVSDWLRRYAKDYNIPAKEKPRVNLAQFEREWYGSVPYLHWTITKPWSVK